SSPDGTTIIPISKVSFGFVSGGSDIPAKVEKEVFAGGSGAKAKSVASLSTGATGAQPGAKADVYGGENFSMQMCLACHRGETFKQKNFRRAATYCAACHR
ncbi:MAG: GerW family sporulation protein, partial [Fibrobacter sp.]|nr:GerW family sporulation protein [Fibrobacter sp.]